MSLKDRSIITLLTLLAKLPLRFNRRLGVLVGDCLWFSRSRSRKVTEKNLQLCMPHLPATERTALARRSLQEFGKTTTEMGAVWLWPAARTMALIQRVHGRELLEHSIDQQHGVIVLAPHIGNWEVLGLFLGNGYAFTALYQPPKSTALDALILRARGRNGTQLAPTNRRGVMALLKALQRGEVVGILPDQVPAPESGLFAPYFGVPALTMTLVSSLLKKTNARVVCAYAKRLPHGGFDIFFEPADESIYDEDATCSLQGLNRSIETCVRKLPEQNQWEYKRFKKRPEGEEPVYKFS
ncbi:MAG: lysophospholipid acyltransferase family protein [Pseudomonadales bacterium]